MHDAPVKTTFVSILDILLDVKTKTTLMGKNSISFMNSSQRKGQDFFYSSLIVPKRVCRVRQVALNEEWLELDDALQALSVLYLFHTVMPDAMRITDVQCLAIIQFFD